MILLFNSIYWIFGVNIILHALSALVALLVSFFSYRAYKLTSDRKYVYLLAGFLLLAVSMVLKAVADIFIYEFWVFFYEPLKNITFVYVHLSASILLMVAYALFVSIYLKAKDLLLYVLVLLSVLLAALSYTGIILFNLIAALMLFFVCLQTYRNFTKRMSLNSFLVFMAFMLLVCSHVFAMFSVLPPNLRFYSLGNVFQLLSYLGLGFMLSRVK
jgi:hypothetical protein